MVDRLKAARREAGLTQSDLARLLKRPQSFVAKVEGYERRLDVLEFVEVAEALRLGTGEIAAMLAGDTTDRAPRS